MCKVRGRHPLIGSYDILSIIYIWTQFKDIKELR